ncbi:MAG: transposase [Patescibacteria group bacterium]|nr:transposase [Patescibacteria group bacterium]
MLSFQESRLFRRRTSTSDMTPQVYKFLKDKVQFICEKLKLSKFSKSTGRKLSISIPDTVTLAPYKQTQGIQTKKSIWEDFKKILKCCYETPVVNMNRWSISALLILKIILGGNGRNSHLIKHSDSADIPVCLNKNAKHHKTMKSPSSLGHSGKGMFFYGLKLHLISDLNRKILSVSFASANVGDREMFMKPNKDLEGIFVADAGYASEKLEREFFIENKRILLAKPRKNMRKVITFSRRNFTTPE